MSRAYLFLKWCGKATTRVVNTNFVLRRWERISPWPNVSQAPLSKPDLGLPSLPWGIQFSENPPPICSFTRLPLVYAVSGIEPRSMLRSLFPYCNSSWRKSVFIAFTTAQFWFPLTLIKPLVPTGGHVIRGLLQKFLLHITWKGFTHLIR